MAKVSALQETAWQGIEQALTATFKAGYERGQTDMTEPEGPAALPWDEKVQRIAGVLTDDIPTDLNPGEAERLAERILVAIGDANV